MVVSPFGKLGRCGDSTIQGTIFPGFKGCLFVLVTLSNLTPMWLLVWLVNLVDMVAVQAEALDSLDLIAAYLCW